MPKTLLELRKIAANLTGLAAHLCCELAFKMDCWGPFEWVHSCGSQLYELESKLCLRWGLDYPWVKDPA